MAWADPLWLGLAAMPDSTKDSNVAGEKVNCAKPEPPPPGTPRSPGVASQELGTPLQSTNAPSPNRSGPMNSTDALPTASGRMVEVRARGTKPRDVITK